MEQKKNDEIKVKEDEALARKMQEEINQEYEKEKLRIQQEKDNQAKDDEAMAIRMQAELDREEHREMEERKNAQEENKEEENPGVWDKGKQTILDVANVAKTKFYDMFSYGT